jgi:hypothetical protein
MLFSIFLILANLSFALNCQELGIRLEKVKTYNIYDELVQYAEGLLKNCQENESYPLALDYLLNALETIYQEKAKPNSKLLKKVADKRTKNSLLMLQKNRQIQKKASPFVFIPTALSCGGNGKQKGRRL